MKRWPVRCVDCGTRYSLPRPPSKYLVERRCKSPMCRRKRMKWWQLRRGGRLRLDRYRKYKERKGSNGTCTCWGYPFQHRKGSKHCRHSSQHAHMGDYHGRASQTVSAHG